MSCGFCAGVRQYVVNVLIGIDLLANGMLGGQPHETLSARTARAELAGNKLAHWACRALGWVDPGHCHWALTPGTPGAEIWHWSPVGEHPQGSQ